MWAGVNPLTVDPAAIAEQMRPALEAWMTAHVKVFDPNRNGSPLLVLDSGANGALVQPLRTPSSNEVGGQPVGIQGIRFQIKRSATVQSGQHLRGGLVVKVIDGGNSPELEPLTYTLLEVADSSIGWDYIFEATTVTGGY